MDVVADLPTDAQAAKPVQQCEGPLEHPSAISSPPRLMTTRTSLRNRAGRDPANETIHSGLDAEITRAQA